MLAGVLDMTKKRHEMGFNCRPVDAAFRLRKYFGVMKEIVLARSSDSCGIGINLSPRQIYDTPVVANKLHLASSNNPPPQTAQG